MRNPINTQPRSSSTTNPYHHVVRLTLRAAIAGSAFSGMLVGSAAAQSSQPSPSGGGSVNVSALDFDDRVKLANMLVVGSSSLGSMSVQSPLAGILPPGIPPMLAAEAHNRIPGVAARLSELSFAVRTTSLFVTSFSQDASYISSAALPVFTQAMALDFGQRVNLLNRICQGDSSTTSLATQLANEQSAMVETLGASQVQPACAVVNEFASWVGGQQAGPNPGSSGDGNSGGGQGGNPGDSNDCGPCDAAAHLAQMTSAQRVLIALHAIDDLESHVSEYTTDSALQTRITALIGAARAAAMAVAYDVAEPTSTEWAEAVSGVVSLPPGEQIAVAKLAIAGGDSATNLAPDFAGADASGELTGRDALLATAKDAANALYTNTQ